MAMIEEGEGGTPLPTTETEPPAAEESNVTDAEWEAMQNLLSTVYAYRTENGEHDPSKLFHRKVNKRAVPDYYDIIKEPMALSVIKSKIATKTFKDFKEFVRDFALIPHNAQVYNSPHAGAYRDALEIKALLETELKKLVDDKVVSEEAATIPYLGEIPPQEEPPPGAGDEDEEEEDDEEDEEEGDESDDSRGKKRGRGRPRGSTAGAKRETKEEDRPDIDPKKRRGRPPRVDTPEEARMKNILKGMRRSKNQLGQFKISHFERLPDKAALPEYYALIKNPVAVDVLKKKMKRKKYGSVDALMKDVEQMFENAKLYNEDDSQIYKDAVDLQEETRKMADEEKAKADSDFVMEDGRLPLPNGILHNGELFKVGDWVHIANPNDITKPLVAQIFRTWQDGSGQKFVNACWYYRPEQTVHRFDKHFYEHEVVKTGQYRDHAIDEIVDRCFVMFITRFHKGRPRNFPSDKDVYVCEARYNEEKHTLNKIKTWASCLPDEVRDKDYEMELFDEPKKMKKTPSPIAYLLKDDAKETDDLPKPEWGAENAPPKIGAVHKRPRDPKESPPPEPTPTPPPREPTPPPPPQPQRSSSTNNITSQSANGYTPNQQNKYPQQPPRPSTQASSNGVQQQPSQNFPSQQQQPRSFQPNISPAPAGRIAPSQSGYSAHTPQTNYNPHMSHNPNIAPQTAPPRYPQPGAAQFSNGVNYTAPAPPEVWALDAASNAQIPPEIRAQFHCDDTGRVIFYTMPPLDVVPTKKEGTPLGHSAKYLVAKKKREELIKQKRQRESEEAALAQEETTKRRKIEIAELDRKREELRKRALMVLDKELAEGRDRAFRQLHGDDWQDKMVVDLERLHHAQEETMKENMEREERARLREG